MNRLILFLLRRKWKLKKFQKFRFTNQRNKCDYYFFTSKWLMKAMYIGESRFPIRRKSYVKLNWLLDDRCKIERVENEQRIIKYS